MLEEEINIEGPIHIYCSLHFSNSQNKVQQEVTIEQSFKASILGNPSLERITPPPTHPKKVIESYNKIIKSC